MRRRHKFNSPTSLFSHRKSLPSPSTPYPIYVPVPGGLRGRGAPSTRFSHKKFPSVLPFPSTTAAAEVLLQAAVAAPTCYSHTRKSLPSPSLPLSVPGGGPPPGGPVAEVLLWAAPHPPCFYHTKKPLVPSAAASFMYLCQAAGPHHRAVQWRAEEEVLLRVVAAAHH